jgi:hypothetical protein
MAGVPLLQREPSMTKLFNISPLILLLASCSTGGESSPPVEPHMGPPVAAGAVCVDVEQDGATVQVNGQQTTERCTQTMTTYSASVLVQVSKPGFETYSEQVSLLRTSPIELAVVLEPRIRRI